MKPTFFIFFFLILTYCSAQTVMTATDFLAKAEEDQTVERQAQFMNYLSSVPPDLPLIEEMEIRTETNDFDLAQQQYLLRMRTNNKHQQQLNRNLHNVRIRLNDAERQLLINEATAERYDLLAHNYFQRILKQKDLELMQTCEDHLRVLRGEAQFGKADPGTLIEREELYFATERDLLKFDNQIAQSKAYCTLLAGSDIDSIDFREGLPDVVEIKAIASRIEAEPDANHVLLSQKQVRLLRTQQRRELEEVESNRWFDYVQARYQNRGDDPFKEEFAVGVGIRLPFKGSKKLDIQELEIDEREEQKEMDQLRNTIALKIYRSKWKLDHLIQEYELLARQHDQSQAALTLGQYRQTEGARPADLLNIKEVILKRERKLIRLHYEVVLQYIDLLEASGKMMTTPRLNYLSKNLESF